MRLGIIANLDKPAIVPVLRELNRLAEVLKIELVCGPDLQPHLPSAHARPDTEVAVGAAMLVVLGGDGTMLSAARALRDNDIPLLGVNLGRLGFMTAAHGENLEQSLERVVRGDYRLSQRSMLSCRAFRGGASAGVEHRALNDVVLGWGSSARVATLRVEVGGSLITTYTCDGLILSTPTGSTGHALSAGGPVIHPEAPALLLTVICPHTLSVRPVVLPDSCEVTVHVEGAKNLLMSVDGQSEPDLSPGDRLEVRRCARSVKLVEFPGQDYFHVLREKLGWRGSNLGENAEILKS